MKEHPFETGLVFPDDDAARVLSKTLDEETMNKIEDDTQLKLSTYDPVQEWSLQKDPSPRREEL